MSGVDVLARSVAEAYSRNSGNVLREHYNPDAAVQWMAQALEECGLRAAIDSLNEIANFSAKTPELDQKRVIAFGDSAECSACQRCRDRSWPPSMLCDEHYREISHIDSAIRDSRKHQESWGRADLARAALTRCGVSK